MEQQMQPQVVALGVLAEQARIEDKVGPAWSLVSEDLNLNLVRFTAGDGVDEHINNEVDVVGIVVAGAGIVTIEGKNERVSAGQLFFVPKGMRRSMRAVETVEGSESGEDFVYLTCHRRRMGLMPTRRG
jgi:quercetin dioxygenase-like cupin family protein